MEIRKSRLGGQHHSNRRWYLGEVFAKINGEHHYRWRAVDHEGEVLEWSVSERRDHKAALKFLRRTMTRFGRSEVLVTDKLQSYRAALGGLSSGGLRRMCRWMQSMRKGPFDRLQYIKFLRLKTMIGRVRSNDPKRTAVFQTLPEGVRVVLFE